MGSGLYDAVEPRPDVLAGTLADAAHACDSKPTHGPVRQEGRMPLFMDVHQKLPEGATAKDVADAHTADLQVQDKFGVKYVNYWVDEASGKVFCLVDAPDAQACHREARGLTADEIYEVQQG